MNVKQIENTYYAALILLAINLILSVLFSVFGINGYMSKVFMCTFCIMSYLNKCEYKKIITKDVLDMPSMFLIGATLISCMSYMVCMSFIAGRYFVRCIL